MNDIKFSCLMSVYRNDKPEHVAIAINSILNQTLKPSQYVIVVDGPISTELKDLLLNYESNNNIIELYFRENNIGLGLTLNEGLEHCKFDYVARMDADDYSEPIRFERQIDLLRNNNDIAVIGSNIVEYDEKLNNIDSCKSVPETDAEIKLYAKTRNPINHPTVIFDKTKVSDVGGYEDYPYFEDYYLWAKMIAKNYKFYNIQENLYKFRGGASMYGRRGGVKYLASIKKMELGLLNLGIINEKEYKKNLFKRYIGALLPNSLRCILYKLMLRDNGGRNE